MAIDGSIWLLSADGQIVKYNRGRKDVFGLAGLDKPLEQTSQIFTDSDSEQLYVVDEGHGQVVVIDKSGEYQAAFQVGNLKEVSGLYANEESGEIFLLKKTLIYLVQD